MTKIYVDGSTKEGCVVIEGSEPLIFPYIEPVTNNEGEYLAVALALDSVGVMSENSTILTDSLLVVNQVNGIWKCRKENLLPLMDIVRSLLSDYRAKLEWIPREENLAGKVLEP